MVTPAVQVTTPYTGGLFTCHHLSPPVINVNTPGGYTTPPQYTGKKPTTSTPRREGNARTREATGRTVSEANPTQRAHVTGVTLYKPDDL